MFVVWSSVPSMLFSHPSDSHGPLRVGSGGGGLVMRWGSCRSVMGAIGGLPATPG